MIEYDQRVLPLSQLLENLESIDREMPAVSQPTPHSASTCQPSLVLHTHTLCGPALISLACAFYHNVSTLRVILAACCHLQTVKF